MSTVILLGAKGALPRGGGRAAASVRQWDRVPDKFLARIVPDAGYIAANSRLAELFGARSAEAIIGRRTSDFFESGTVERYDGLDQAVASGRTLIDRFD